MTLVGDMKSMPRHCVSSQQMHVELTALDDFLRYPTSTWTPCPQRPSRSRDTASPTATDTTALSAWKLQPRANDDAKLGWVLRVIPGSMALPAPGKNTPAGPDVPLSVPVA